jgi:protein involved in polysaccharide export with SLBB domain
MSRNTYGPADGLAQDNLHSCNPHHTVCPRPTAFRRWRQWAALPMVFGCALLAGCAAFHPIDGLPARYLPNEFHAESRAGRRTIDLSLLRQTPSPQYCLDTGDVLGVYIEGVLGRREETPPVHFPQDNAVPPAFGFPMPIRDDGTVSLPLIEPIYVRGMTLRQLEDTIREAYLAKKKILQPDSHRIVVSLLKPRCYRVLVIRQEGSDVGTFSGGGQGQFNLGVAKRGTGCVVDLPAYKNDVLNALALTGGLPGLDAENVIYIIRNRNRGICPLPPPTVAPMPEALPSPDAEGAVPMSHYAARGGIMLASAEEPAGTEWGHSVDPEPIAAGAAGGAWGHSDSNVNFAAGTTPQGTAMPMVGTMAATPIPQVAAAPAADAGTNYRSATMEPLPAAPHAAMAPHQVPAVLDESWLASMGYDATIASDRVVKIPVRLCEGQVPQFCEQDIVLQDGDVVFIESRETEIFYTGGLLGGGQYTLPRDYDLDVLGAVSIAESQNNQNTGRSLGGVSALNQDVTVSASNVIILRALPNGTQVPIKVDLYEAVRNPAERILIQPGDYVILQYTCCEAALAFIERHLLAGALWGIAGSGWNNNNN